MFDPVDLELAAAQRRAEEDIVIIATWLYSQGVDLPADLAHRCRRLAEIKERRRAVSEG